MKWFRSDLVESAADAYTDLVRSAIENYREREYVKAIGRFRDAAKVRPLDAHHEVLLSRAISKWKRLQHESSTS